MIAATFQIEKGVPIPPPMRTPGAGHSAPQRRYPWDRLEVGDSFTVAIEGTGRATQHGILAAALRRQKRSPHKYTSRVCGDVVRVWRVA